ncbi:PP2C family protein-serine/threonine phosphatase [Alloacidobacterium dinghuense]|uniref:PP2C family protein-serine/threonine phosphatase n=1 Tax=Alloacidobacterium dinghuense TaxID=2763107 RepID=A0A7G8BHX7_9BACT|nr:PP2C family protein-serine/threonine phosphatase [Alloacidobacterium dinghuense]QNI32147.1 PP2C family protein-serine/threonine phosphatase [Alloacidobacterium dinghuense]
MATPHYRQQRQAVRRDPFRERAEQFWQRVTEGMELSELWSQFRKDAHSSYRLYSQEVDATRTAGVPHSKHFFRVASEFFWAIVEKLTPARRVLLLAALILVIVPGGEWTFSTRSHEVKIFALDFHFYGGLLMFALLILEVGDRVVMKRDLQIAKEIQAWLLPSEPPLVPGLEIAFATRPANTVAGDYYDVFARASAESERSPTFLIAVADVAGKSVPAAMLMATFQASLKTLSTTPGSLVELANRMNRYACSNSQRGRRFTTAFIAEYDTVSRRLTYVNAGHNNPILRRKSGAIERLEAGGMPFGIMEDAAYQSGERVVEAGDWLAIFTDGVVEAENAAQQEYGEVRFITMLHSGVMLAPSMLLNSVLADLDRFVGNAPQHDDVTCVLMRAV